MNHNLHKHNDKTKAPLFEPGTVVYSKADPATQLAVITYSQGIYYCAVLGNAQKYNLPFLECQLDTKHGS